MSTASEKRARLARRDRACTTVFRHDRLNALGFKLAIRPATGFLAASHAPARAYAELRAIASSKDIERPLAESADLNRLVGFPDILAFNERYASLGRHA
jgi:hypothetical protein